MLLRILYSIQENHFNGLLKGNLSKFSLSSAANVLESFIEDEVISVTGVIQRLGALVSSFMNSSVEIFGEDNLVEVRSVCE